MVAMMLIPISFNKSSLSIYGLFILIRHPWPLLKLNGFNINAAISWLPSLILQLQPAPFFYSSDVLHGFHFQANHKLALELNFFMVNSVVFDKFL